MMDRREFIRNVLATGAIATGPSVGGCAVAPVKPDGSPEPVPVDAYLRGGARVMWCAPHPDDECFPGALLARAGIYHGNRLYFLILTHGEGGTCGLRRGCHPDLATVRGEEMRRAAGSYRATLQHEHFFNAPLPVSSFPPRHRIYDIWRRQGDPVHLVAAAIRRFQPDLLLTFDPHWGATGHPEHQLTSRVATAGVRMAADREVDMAGLGVHRVARTYYVLNRYWPLVLVGRADPGPVTETFDAALPCRYGFSCLDFMVHATHAHRTQHGDMGTVRDHRGAFATMRLRQVDPFEQVLDPAAPA